jgi:hypothetical protein
MNISDFYENSVNFAKIENNEHRQKLRLADI